MFAKAGIRGKAAILRAQGKSVVDVSCVGVTLTLSTQLQLRAEPRELPRSSRIVLPNHAIPHKATQAIVGAFIVETAGRLTALLTRLHPFR